MVFVTKSFFSFELFILSIAGPDKTVVIDENNNIFSSTVSPYTVIKRISLSEEDFIWRKR